MPEIQKIFIINLHTVLGICSGTRFQSQFVGKDKDGWFKKIEKMDQKKPKWNRRGIDFIERCLE